MIEQCCVTLHDAYEATAADTGWEADPASVKTWAQVSEADKATMRVAVAVLLDDLALI